MKHTQNLGLPIFDKPETDLFKISEWNEGNETIDKTYGELKKWSDELPLTNADAEMVDARCGERTLGDKVRNIDTQLESKASKDDVAKISSGTPLFASSVSGMTDTTKNYVNTTDGFLYVYLNNVWTKTNVQYQSTGIEDKSIDIKKMAVCIQGKNMFNKNAITVDRYLSNGSLIFSGAYNVSDFISVNIGTYTLNNLQFGSVEFFGQDKVFKYVINETKDKKGVVTFPITENGYVRFTIRDLELNTTQLEVGSNATTFEDYMYKIPSKYIDGITNNEGNSSTSKTIITVEKSGGMFNSISSALASITDASETNRYEIRVGLGTFTETFRTKHYVDIIGKDKYKTIITFTGDVSTWNDTSTIFAESECKLANFTVEGTDTKYPMHIDKATGQWTCILENVRMIHHGSLTDNVKGGTPIGIGLYPYQFLVLKNCEMIYQGTNFQAFGASGIYFHNQIDGVGTGYRSIRIEECNIKGVTYGIRPNDVMGTSTLQNNDAYIINNSIRATHQEYYYPENSPSWNLFKKGNEYTQGS